MTHRIVHAPQRPRVAARPLLATSLLALLTACGGGGGGGEDEGLGQPLAITTSNRDLVAQTTASAVMSVGSGLTALPLSASGPDQGRQAAARPAATPRGALLPVAVQRWVRSALQRGADTGMKRALAVVGPTPVGCTYGGSASVTLNDADNNGDLSAGDTVSMQFNACVEEPGIAVSGQLSLSVTSYAALPLMRVAGTMTFAGLAATSADGTATIDGTLGFDMAELDSNSERMTVTAQSPVSTRFSGGLAGQAVTLATGYQETNLIEYSVQPPGGGSWTGRTTVTFGGTVSAPGLGGTLAVSTTSPLVQYDSDLYPRSGVVRVQGLGSTLRLTVQSANEVLLELDADGNGSYEDSRVVTWTWLM